MRNYSTEWSSTEIKEYRTKDGTLRNTTGNGKVGGEMAVYVGRERAIRKILGEPNRSNTGNAKPTGETMSEYRVVNSIKGSRQIENTKTGNMLVCDGIE